MPTLSLSHCQLHYHDISAQSGTDDTLVLLHANPGDSQDYAAVIPELSKHKRIIAIDWPGYGGASTFTKPLAAFDEISPILFYEILLEAWDKLGLASAHVMGNSIGGNVAARLAATHPDKVKSLVLISPGGFTHHNPFTKAFCRFQGSRLGLSSLKFAYLYLRKRNDTTNALLARAKSAQSAKEPTQLSRAMWRSFKTDNNDIRELAKQITAPTTLIFGKYDPVIPAITDGRSAKKSIPHAQMHVLPCGHVAFAEVPEKFLERVTL